MVRVPIGRSVGNGDMETANARCISVEVHGGLELLEECLGLAVAHEVSPVFWPQSELRGVRGGVSGARRPMGCRSLG